LHFKSLLNSPCWTPIGQFVSHLHSLHWDDKNRSQAASCHLGWPWWTNRLQPNDVENRQRIVVA
jgi:hypothetical protein